MFRNVSNGPKSSANRRSFLKKGLTAGTATLGAGLLANSIPLFGQDMDDDEAHADKRRCGNSEISSRR